MTQTQSLQFKTETIELIKKIVAKYPEGKHKSALIPVLHIAQSEFGGWLSAETMELVANTLKLQPIEVYETASFYSMFNLKPVGKCLIEVCRTSSCWLCGAEDIIDHLETKLGIQVGETTQDGMFTLKAVECLGSCGTAPMMQVGYEYHENLSIERVDNLIDQFKKEDKHSRYC